MRIELVGGVHDSRERTISRRPGSFIYVECAATTPAASFTVHSEDAHGRVLYKFDTEHKKETVVVLKYLAADLTTVRCPGCQGFHERGYETCTMCGESLKAVS